MKRLWNKYAWLLPVILYILYGASVFYAGYVIAGSIKDWAKSHIIIVKEIQ